MTFIPDPDALTVGDTLYLTKERFIENYGTFTVGHEFQVSSKYLQYYPASDGPYIQVASRDQFGIFDIPKRDLSRVRP